MGNPDFGCVVLLPYPLILPSFHSLLPHPSLLPLGSTFLHRVHIGSVISLIRNIPQTQATPTRDGLGGHLPDMSPLKRGRDLEATWLFPDPV